MTHTPQFRALSRPECHEVLKANHLGRIAFVHDGNVDIEPITYVFSCEWLFMRSGPGTKLEALAHNPFVAFEVDEVRGLFDWRSVVVHGTIYMLPSDGAPIERHEFDHAVTALRKVVPDAFTENDPAPDRQHVYGLHVDHMTGRMASSRSAAKAGASR